MARLSVLDRSIHRICTSENWGFLFGHNFIVSFPRDSLEKKKLKNRNRNLYIILLGGWTPSSEAVRTTLAESLHQLNPTSSFCKMENQNIMAVVVIWRDKHIKVDMNVNSSVRELGQKLQSLTKVKAETMRLLVPQSASKSSKLITPFTDEYSSLCLHEIAILKGKPIRMMGVFEHEVEEVSQNSLRPDLRIRGFEEEEERLRQRLLNTPESPLKLPQGPYIFCGFRTLQLSGIELNPPPSEALRRMQMLACDPGIIAIMNKHRWRVGIMTEMAPVGYVGISSKCVLGFNKNCGEEISLRLRTDNLKGFRKYESIKKTLLHELAHMVYSEHDANFYALDKQLNQEAVSLDWTKSASRTLNGQKVTDHYESVLDAGSSNEKSLQKLGGRDLSVATNARESSVAAAYGRLFSVVSNGPEDQLQVENVSADHLTENIPQISDKGQISNVAAEPDLDDSKLVVMDDNTIVIPIDDMQVKAVKYQSVSPVPKGFEEPDPDDGFNNRHIPEPDPDDSLKNRCMFEPDPDDSLIGGNISCHGKCGPDGFSCHDKSQEPDPDDSEVCRTDMRYGEVPGNLENVSPGTQVKDLLKEMRHIEPDPDDSKAKNILVEPANNMKCYSDGAQKKESAAVEPDPDDSLDDLNEELHRIEEPVAVMCKRLQKAIEMLRSEATPVDAASSLQTLVKVIRNVIDHPDEIKFRRLRKANPLFQRNIANYKAAMDVLNVIGFCEDVVADEFGRMETYLILRRNDPGLLWLAISSIEVTIS